MDQIIEQEDTPIIMSSELRKPMRFRKSQMGNASFSSARTAATSLLGSIDETCLNEYDGDDSSVLLWEGLEDSFLVNSSYKLNLPADDDEHDVDDHDDCCSESSLDWHELQDDRFVEPYESFHASYDLGTSLGQGAFGSVHRCQLKNKTKKGSSSFAVKTVPTEIYDQEEMEILQELQDCPQIVQVKEVFHDLDASYIVMEEIEGGELLERIGQKECYNEKEAKVLFKTLLETVQFCHSRGIAHCDLKPENIMLVSKEDDTTMKLVDFGLAKRFRHQDGSVERMMDMVGSAEYAAPEVFNRCPVDGGDGYDERADIWSCGVLLYVLLGGYAPFEANTPEEMIKVVGRGKYRFHKHYWKDISKEAKTLIASMMQVDPDKRCSLQEALASTWFDQE